MKFLSSSTTRRVALIVVAFATLEIALLGFTLRGLSLLAAIGSFGGAVRDWSASRQVAVDSLREYVKSGRAADLAQFDAAVATLEHYARVRHEISGAEPSTDVIATELLAAGLPSTEVSIMVSAVPWVRFTRDYEPAMMSWSAFDHQVNRLAETANELRYRRERKQPVTADDVLARIDRHDRLLRQVADDFAASLSDSSRWLHDRLAAAELAATVLLLSTCVSLALVLVGRVRRSERARADIDQRYQALVTQDAVGIWQHSRDGEVLFANPALLRMFGVDRQAALRPWERFFGAENLEVIRSEQGKQLDGVASTFEVEIQPAGRNDQVRLLISGSPVTDDRGVVQSIIGTCLDITERKNLETRLSHLASRDPLTDLFNRRRFEEELDREVTRANRNGGHSALLWCDLDRFKEINDTLGHHTGDRLLIHVANALRAELRTGEILGRLGGDEFGVLVHGAGRREAEVLAKRLLEVVSHDALEVGGQSVHATASIGLVILPADGATAEQVLSHADIAMYQAKREGRNRYSVFTLENDVRAALGSQLTTAEMLRSCLREDRLVLHMQPIVELHSGEVARWEALVRMPAPDGTLLQPASFLPIATRFGLARDVDRWVLARAVDLVRDYARRGERVVVAVNLSSVWLADEELPEVAGALCGKAGVDPASLVFEIKERAAVHDQEGAKRLIDRLVALGAQVAVDDFGLGFSSFDLFRRLQVRYLKIDGSFIRGLGDDSINRALVRAMIEMAHTLGMVVVAEYVDSAETLSWLTDQHCDFGEGWFLGRARPIEELLHTM